VPVRVTSERIFLMTNKKSHAGNGLRPDDCAEAVRRTPGLIPRTPGTIFLTLLGVLLFFCGILLGIWLIVRFRRDT
jgi:hypothetical protein